MKFGVIVFPGSNCDRDLATITKGVYQQATRLIWHTETDLTDLDVVMLPGGFSYGDYLRCGAIARFSPVISAVLDHAAQGKYVLGICNGFQVLTEIGLLPGALMRNRDLHFICDRIHLTINRYDLPWTNAYSSVPITLPIAHGEGCYYADQDTVKRLQDQNQIVFQYCDQTGKINPDSNPNGAIANIAGICNPKGNVLGMMPHPERAADPRVSSQLDGMPLFTSLMNHFQATP